MLLCKDLIMVERNPHVTMQCIKQQFNETLVFMLVPVCSDRARAEVELLQSMIKM